MEAIIISGLIGVQITQAISLLFLHKFLILGVDSFFVVISLGFISCLILLPFVFVFEKREWPTKLSPLLMAQMLFLSLSSAVLQVLFVVGNKMTSPAIASSMNNTAPGVVFVIAACARFEKFSIGCKYSRAKVVGTILCMCGAISMSLLMNPLDGPESTPSIHSSPTFNIKMVGSVSKEWILGCFCLFGAVVLLSSSQVLQAATMIHFPAPLSLCAVTSFMGSIITAFGQFIMEGELHIGSSNMKLTSIAIFVLLMSCWNGVNLGYQMWCVGKRGPLIVSVFSPIQTVSSALLSNFLLGQVLGLGSLTGMLLMFVGLYTFLWAKRKEESDANNTNKIVNDIERPLLS